jgi:RNA polymerase sigma-70 factor (ECF subfamily)
VAPFGTSVGVSWDWRWLTQVAVREARRLLRDRDDAEDAAQEAILRAYRARSRCTTPESPAPWVRAIARNESYRLISRRTPQVALVDAPEPYTEGHADAVHDRLLATSAVGTLAPGDRLLLVRRYVFDQTSAQLGSELEMPAATVRVRLHRARSRIREQLEAA